MISTDTNVLVRYLVEDDARQAAAAARAFAAAAKRGETIFVSQIVLCEMVWVLARAYRRTRSEIAGVLGMLSKVAEMEIEGGDDVRRAADAYAEGKGDFADYLIRERSRTAGCDAVLTFDRALLNEPGFVEPR